MKLARAPLVLVGLCTVMFSGLWGMCLLRAFRFHQTCLADYQIFGDVDFWNDLIWARYILILYGLSALIGLGLIWLMWRRNMLQLTLLILVNWITAAYLLYTKPEQGIVHFPTGEPFLAVALNLLLAVMAGIAVGVSAWRRRRRG